MRALSIRQPWAWLIVNGHKDIENRDWATKFRGDVLVHAGKAMPRSYYEDIESYIRHNFQIQLPPYEKFERGGIVGIATISDCVDGSDSRWFQGAYGFVISEASRVPFHPCNGMLGFFDVVMP